MNASQQLRNVAGQITGILAMIEQKRDCADVLPQLQAAKAGIEKGIALYLETEMEQCLAASQASPVQRKKLEMLVRVLSKT